MNDGSPSGAPKFSGTQIQLLPTTIALDKVVMTALLYSLYHTWVGVHTTHIPRYGVEVSKDFTPVFL
jgi:hypothetical protein